MAISPARQIAFEVLRRVQVEGAYASEVLRAELGARVKPADAALATELALGVLRWQRLLDFLLDLQTGKRFAVLDVPVAIALRLGLYQLRFLQKIPPHAAVNESVELVKRARKSSAASLVNAVLRRSSEQRREPKELVPENVSPAERLGILHSHPTWMVERWLKRYGETRATALLNANNRAPLLSCAVNGPDDREAILGSLKKEGLQVSQGVLLEKAFSVSGGSPSGSDAFRSGEISIQDEASQAIPLLLEVQPGNRVLDLCAAPGGKTGALVRAAGQHGFVVAADLHTHRLRDMQMHLARLGYRNVPRIELDATRALPFRGKFDRILVDAPCSGTGTLARHPEIRWRLRPEQLVAFRELQIPILANALAQLVPGGKLVYSTCSLEPEENEQVIQAALRLVPGTGRAPASQVVNSLAPHLVRSISAETFFDDRGQFRTFPGEYPCDGFFAAILSRL